MQAFVDYRIMKPNHLNLAVPDVLETRAFFEKYFGFRHSEGMKGNDDDRGDD